MGALMRELDWSQTPLGALSDWLPSLRTAVSILLNSRFPMFIWWGPELINLYNDAYIPVLGKRHPTALGQPAKAVWTDIWETVGAQAEIVFKERRATWNEELLLVMERNGFTEETYFTFSYSPVFDEQGAVCALFCACTEDTARVLSQRRLRTLRQLAEQAATAQTVEAAGINAARVLSENGHDLPFSLLYLLSVDRTHAHLAGTARLKPGADISPYVIELADQQAAWPLQALRNSEQELLVTNLVERFGKLPGGVWPEAPHEAAVLPLAKPGEQQPTGFLVAGFSPRLTPDEEYVSFLKLAAGHVATALANARTFEQERQRADALAELNQAKVDFFSNISHEFRTPLTLLLAPLEDALNEPQLLPAVRRQLELAQRNGQRLLKLVNALLDFSRSEAGRLRAQFEPTDLASFTTTLASFFYSAIEKAGLNLRINCAPLPELVHVDREMWEKIVFNLLSNAFKFTFAGEIEISLRYNAPTSHEALPSVVFSVRDTGTGIPAADLPHLFTRFHRVKGARGRSIEGSGIGLALVQELVNLHSGTISVESRFNQGSTFTVTLPVTQSATLSTSTATVAGMFATSTEAKVFAREVETWLHEQAPTAPSKASSLNPTAALDPSQPFILLADDNADMREYVQRLLSERWQVVAVADGAAALALAQEWRPALILSDVMMPELDGFALLNALRADEQTRTIPVILLSARAGEEARVAGIEAGADDYLTKPFSARELLARVNTHLELALSRRAIVEERERILATERSARAAAEAATRAKDEFLSVVSHELRSPLNSILGYARLLRSGPLDQTRVRQTVEIIERAASMQKQLIEDLLDTARVTSGKLRLDIRPVNLVSVIHQAIENIFPAAQAKNIALVPTLNEDAGQITGDPERLQQVIWNLLSNAVKYTQPGGRVMVTLARIDPHIQLIISDTGKGISPDFLPHVFDRFSQSDASSSRRYGGLGLGLALVKNLVELHGGTIEAFSKGDGQGAAFKVALPVRAIYTPTPDDEPNEFNTLPEHAESNETELAGVRTLVVDDEDDARRLVTELLEKHGAIVTAASSAQEAFTLVTENPGSFDLLVSDIGLPEEDGYAFLHRVREWEAERGLQLPALALTAYSRTEDRIRALMAGFQMHVPKPVDAAELILVAASLARHVFKEASGNTAA